MIFLYVFGIIFDVNHRIIQIYMFLLLHYKPRISVYCQPIPAVNYENWVNILKSFVLVTGM